MMLDDNYLLELASQRVQIARNLKLIDQMVGLRKTELEQKYSDELLRSRADCSTISKTINTPSGEFVSKTGFQFEDDDDNSKSSIFDLLYDEDDDEDDDEEDPTQGMTEVDKARFMKIREDHEKQQQEFQQQLEKKRQEKEAFERMTPGEQQQFLIKQELSSYKDELIGIAKGNQERFDRLAISKGVLDEDMVELKKSQDIMYGRRAITGECMDKW